MDWFAIWNFKDKKYIVNSLFHPLRNTRCIKIFIDKETCDKVIKQNNYKFCKSKKMVV